MNEELKPCPFCGNDPKFLKRFKSGDGENYGILCRRCGAHGPSNDSYIPCGDEGWNTRPAPSVESVEERLEKAEELLIRMHNAWYSYTEFETPLKSEVKEFIESDHTKPEE